MSQVKLDLKNDRAELERLRPLLAQFGAANGLSGDVLHALELALEEVLTNVIKYAYDDQKDHTIVVRLSRVESVVITEVEDDGRPFNPLEFPRPVLDLPLEQVAIGGLGIQVVREYMDHLEYHRQRQRNCLVMRKHLA